MLVNKKKFLLKNPGSLRAHVSELSLPLQWIDNLENLLNESSQTAKARQQLSRKIGALKKQNQPIENELEEMKRLSLQLGQLDTRIEDSLAEGEGLLGSTTTQPETAPKARQLPEFMQAVMAAAEPANGDVPETQADPPVTITVDFDSSEWKKYVDSNTANHIYHDLRWREVIETSFAQTTRYLLARDTTGSVVGVLPLAQLQSALFGKFLISLPYFNYGGPLADNDAIARQLIAAAGAYSTEQALEHVELRETAARMGFPCKTHKVSMILKLPETIENLMSSLGAKLRSQAGRAERAGATATFGGIELLDDFYYVFCRNMRDLGTPVYSKGFFRNILETFADETCLHVVKIDGKPAAAGFLVSHRDTVEIPWASSLRRYNNLSVNMLLYRSVLEWSISNGFGFFDFGRSSTDGATYRFKQQWGSEPVQLHWNYCLPDGNDLPSLSPDNPKFALFIAIWKRLPVFASNLIGPHIVRNLP